MKNTMQSVPKPVPQAQRKSVVVATRLKKTSEMIDSFGNTIDPVTKQIIRKNS